MEMDRAAGEAQTGSETAQLSGGEGRGGEGLGGAVTESEQVEEGRLAEPATKPRGAARSLLHRRELAAGRILSKVVFH